MQQDPLDVRHPELLHDRRREDPRPERPAEHRPELRVEAPDAQRLEVPVLLEHVGAAQRRRQRHVAELDQLVRHSPDLQQRLRIAPDHPHEGPALETGGRLHRHVDLINDRQVHGLQQIVRALEVHDPRLSHREHLVGIPRAKHVNERRAVDLDGHILLHDEIDLDVKRVQRELLRRQCEGLHIDGVTRGHFAGAALDRVEGNVCGGDGLVRTDAENMVLELDVADCGIEHTVAHIDQVQMHEVGTGGGADLQREGHCAERQGQGEPVTQELRSKKNRHA
mmetsp:Transcript_67461/g.113019  ORF Transcript_67461/g.113019 Transcript_67461/m.113019 type:complete len:280 (-) Transcript_67461:10-849(-)